HDGLYGAARFAEAAEFTGVQTIYGAELSLSVASGAASGLGDRPVLGPTPSRTGVPDPEGDHLLVLARGVEGYHGLSRAITHAQLRGGKKGRPRYDVDDLVACA